MGQYPSYLEYWKMTANHNQNCDFYVLTDQVKYSYKEKNIYFLPLTFNELKTKVENFIGQPFEDLSNDNAIKISDARILLSDLYSEIVDRYEWSGWFEFDSFLGDFNYYLTDSVFEEYDMIGYYGNNKLIYGPLLMFNNKHKQLYKKIPDYKNLITNNGDLFQKYIGSNMNPRWGTNLTDEIHLSKAIDINNIKVYENFNGLQIIRQGNPKTPFTWDNGNLIVQDVDKSAKWIEKYGNKSFALHLKKPHNKLVFEKIENENKFICKSI
jgi:hypothetical protein